MTSELGSHLGLCGGPSAHYREASRLQKDLLVTSFLLCLPVPVTAWIMQSSLLRKVSHPGLGEAAGCNIPLPQCQTPSGCNAPSQIDVLLNAQMTPLGLWTFPLINRERVPKKSLVLSGGGNGDGVEEVG